VVIFYVESIIDTGTTQNIQNTSARDRLLLTPHKILHPHSHSNSIFPIEKCTNRPTSTLTIHFLKDRQAVTLDSRTLTACLTFQKCMSVDYGRLVDQIIRIIWVELLFDDGFLLF